MNDLNHSKTIIIGIGNSGRKDDGLGWALVESIRDSGHFLGDTLLQYQLQVEDAELICHYDKVVFIDAFHGTLRNGFEMKTCQAAPTFSFTSHDIDPESILYLCQHLYDSSPEAYLFLMEGEEWQLEIGLSDKAKGVLQKSLHYFEEELATLV